MQIRIRFLILFAFIVIFSFGIAGAVERMVIAEMITNTGCLPCYPADMALDEIAVNYEGVASIIRYHWWYPDASDPYYNFNLSENTARNNYYSNNYSPRLFIDGSIDAGYGYGSWESRIDQQSFVPSPLIISLDGNYVPDTRMGSIDVRVIAVEPPGASSLRLRVALIEDEIHWQAPNGVPVHEQTFRDMIPGTAGQGIALAQGDTVDLSYNFTLASQFNADNCKFIVFVQSDVNPKPILQGARITIPDLYATAVDDEVVPNSFALKQNYPNPFNAETRIEFETTGGRASLEIFNITGALVNTLTTDNLSAGRHSVIWNGADRAGNAVSSGVYFYRLKDSGTSEMRKMTLLK
jgi:hypothetical protein